MHHLLRTRIWTRDDIAASAARSCGCKALMHLLCLQRWKDTQQDYNGLCFVCGIAID